MSDYLFLIHRLYDVRIHAFVLMPNHFHLLMGTPLANLDQAMARFMRETSRYLTSESNRINLTYGQRHHRSILDSPLSFMHAYKYVYRNPVKAKLVANVEDYRFSTLNGFLGKSHQWIPVAEDKTLFEDPEGILKWLNQEPSEADWSAVRCALRKGRFELRKDEKRNLAHRLNFDML